MALPPPPTPPLFPSGNFPQPSTTLTAPAPVDAQRRRQLFSAYMESLSGTRTGSDTLILLQAQGTTANFAFAIRDRRSVATRSISVEATLKDLKRYLIPQVKDLAQVFGVSRPTIYAWLNNESKPGTDYIQRMADLHGLVLYAKIAFGDLPLKHVHSAIAESTLIALLSRRELPAESVINGVIDQIASNASVEAGQRKARRRIDIVQRSLALGNNPELSEETRLQTDILTGKGFGAEDS